MFIIVMILTSSGYYAYMFVVNVGVQRGLTGVPEPGVAMLET